MATRKSDIQESFGENAFIWGIGGIVALGAGITLYIYRGSGALIGLAWILMLGGAVGIVAALVQIVKARQVSGKDIACVYCGAANSFVEPPQDDFRCSGCNRLVPIKDGVVLPVFQVRCGYCNSLNYYSEKTEVLLCEECDREIPIAHEDGRPSKHVLKAYAFQDDDRTYEFILTGVEHRTEELIAALQHLLALNRNQVKQLIEDAPITLLTGITRKKAEMLQAQLAIHHAATEFRPIDSGSTAGIR
jgi:hypothetical protein